MNLDRWFVRQVEAGIRKGPKGDKTAGCVDEIFLKSYAEKPTSFSLTDDRVEHVSSCSYCMGCLLELRATRQPKGFRSVRYIAVAWCVLASVIAGGIIAFVLDRWHPATEHIQLDELRRTLDLSQQFATHVPVHLPAARLRLEIVLPAGSKPGIYDVTVAADDNGGKRMAQAAGSSTGADPRVSVAVSLDLRNVPPGRYELSIKPQGEKTPHLYPLEIDRL